MSIRGDNTFVHAIIGYTNILCMRFFNSIFIYSKKVHIPSHLLKFITFLASD